MLYLFSSNVSPLYSQDILDLLAAPSGSIYRFRYTDKYLNPQARSKWAALAGSPLLVHFSIQQEAHYHPAVFIPVRRGTVQRTWTEDTFQFIEFVVGDYVSLADPRLDTNKAMAATALGKDVATLKSDEVLAFYVNEYAELLEKNGVETPYKYSASDSAVDVTSVANNEVQAVGDSTKIFQDVTRYLVRTESFRTAHFLRFLDIQPVGSPAGVTPDAQGVFELEGGVSYELRILQAQPGEIRSRVPFKVSVDSQIVRVIGSSFFDVASSYDVVEIPIHAIHPGTEEPLETVLTITPKAGIQGPAIKVRIRVTPSARRAKFARLSAASLVVAGVPSIWTDLSPWLKLLILFVGAYAAAYFWLRAPAGRPPPAPI